jgi:uncharacterized protein (TIGR02145 family)/prepilin-type N-terminal cleavage/methylation domain-containing protein
MKNKAFTLIELLIVIGIIAVLASAVIIAINPGQMFSAARDSTRKSHLNTLNKSLLSYSIDNSGQFPPDITVVAKEICNTNLETPDCTNLVDLSILSPGYLTSIPVDPRGGVSPNGTGYFVFLLGSSVSLSARQAETEYISLSPCPSIFKDARDNNQYTAVEIGAQCWMSKNLAYLPSVVGPATGSTTDPYYYVYDYDGTDVAAAKATANYQEKGALYNWTAASTACPSGWRLPTDAEQHTLDLKYATGICNPNRGSLWQCAPTGQKIKVSTFGGNNISGFSATSSGIRRPVGDFASITTNAFFWSSSQWIPTYMYRRELRFDSQGVNRAAFNSDGGLSVRCLRD